MKFSAILVFLLPVIVTANTLKKAEKLFQEGSYKKAQVVFADLSKKLSGDDQQKAKYRSIESLALSGAMEKAYQEVLTYKLPKSPKWSTLFLLLRSDLAQFYYKQMRYRAKGPAKTGKITFREYNASQWRLENLGIFLRIWPKSKAISEINLKDLKGLVQTNKRNLSRFPTLYDLYINNFSNYLKQLDGASIQFYSLAELKKSLKDRTPPKIKDAPSKNLVRVLSHGQIYRKGRVTAANLWTMDLISAAVKSHVSQGNNKKTQELLSYIREQQRLFKSKSIADLLSANAAMLLRSLDQIAAAVETCKVIAEAKRSTLGRDLCFKIYTELTFPSYGLIASYTNNSKSDPLNLTIQNIETLYFRVYKINTTQLMNSFISNNGKQARGLRYLQRVSFDYKDMKPVDEFSYSPQYDVKHKSQNFKLSTKKSLEKGLYLVLTSTDKGFSEKSKSLLKGTILSISDIVLMGSMGIKETPQKFYNDYYFGGQANGPIINNFVFEGSTGQAVNGAQVVGRKWANGNEAQTFTEVTNANGLSQHAYGIFRPSQESLTIDTIARKGDMISYYAYPDYFSARLKSRVIVFTELDRPIYRPGQKIKGKLLAFEHTSQGYKPLKAKHTIKVEFNDSNGAKIESKDLIVNAFGSSSFEFEIPKGRLLGQYSIRSRVSAFKDNFSDWKYVPVEEYKRPEFELKVDEGKGEWTFGKQAKVSGKAMYYFGGAVPGAKITYRVYEQDYYPFYDYFFFRGGSSYGRNEIAFGSTTSNKKGEYSFSVKLPKSKTSKKFFVEVEARDSGGRTIKADKSFLASTQEFFVSAETDQGFFTTLDDVNFDIKLANINQQPLSGLGTVKLFKLNPNSKKVMENNWIQELLAWKDRKQVKSQKVKVPKTGKRDLHFGNLEAGAYVLSMSFKGKAKKPITGELPFVVVGEKGGLQGWKLNNLMLVQKKSYKPGDTLRILFGDSRLKSGGWYQTWYGEFMLNQQRFSGPGPILYTKSIGESDQGGLAFRWFGVHNFNVYSQTVDIPIDWATKQLRVKLGTKNKYEPGSRAKFNLSVNSFNNIPVTAEYSLRSYDKSLEYYQTASRPWIERVYQSTQYTRGVQQSTLSASSEDFVKRLSLYEILRASKFRYSLSAPPSTVFSDLINPSRRSKGRGGYIGRAKSMAFNEDLAAADELYEGDAEAEPEPVMAQAPARKRAKNKSKKKLEKSKDDSKPKEVQARENFSETAAFVPQGVVVKGKGEYQVKLPDRLTTWKSRIIAHTKDLDIGQDESEFQTQKDLMIRAEIPRFVRELDRLTVTAVVDKLIDKSVKGSIELGLKHNGKKFKGKVNRNMKQSFSLSKSQQTSVRWSFDIPEELGELEITMTLKAGKLTDAEKKTIPILPSRQRVVDSILAFFSANETKTLKLKPIKKVKGNSTELLSLSVEPQLATQLLESIPSLVNYPYECTEQLMNKFVPLSTVKFLFDSQPGLAKVLSQKPSRTSILPPWEDDDPRRLIKAMETPWLAASKGYEARDVVNLFKPTAVASNFKRVERELRNRQLSNGAFVWFPGGKEDLYITLYVLDSLAMAQLYGYKVDRNLITKAFGYVFRELNKMNKWNKENNLRQQTLTLYSAYIVTSFPQSWSKKYKGWNRAKKILSEAKKIHLKLSRYSKAMAAMALFRTGDKDTAKSWMKTILDNSTYDALTGRSWAVDPQSWMWYSDTVESHAFILKVLSEMKMDQKAAGELVQWLLFNKKGNEWKSTKTSAAAISSIVQYLKSINGLQGVQTYSVEWGGQKRSYEVKAVDLKSQNIRWDMQGDLANKKPPEVKISKKGAGLAFASLTRIASVADVDEGSSTGPMSLKRNFFLKSRSGKDIVLKPIKKGAKVKVGQVVVVEFLLETKSEFEYVHLQDPRGAGFESEILRSGWEWSSLSRYQEPKDSMINFFMGYIPKGRYRIRHELRAVTPGVYKLGAARIQSMYSPDFGAYTDTAQFTIE